MSNERVAQVEMLIRFFNMQAGTSYKVSIEKNQKAVSDAIDRANGDIVMLKNYIRDYVKENEKLLVECFESFEGNPPKEVEIVEVHQNFRVVSAGNTYGLGANYDYVGRNQLDMASLDRFAMVRVDYSRAIELKVANGNEELVNFCEDFRKASVKAGVRCVISYRAIGRLAKMEQLFDLKEAIATCLTKSLEKDDLNAIKSCMEVQSGKYYKALLEVIHND